MLEPFAILGLIAAGLAAGWIGGALGIGGGVLLVPVLHLGLGLPIATAVGTSLLMITATSTAAGLGYLRDREVDMRWAVRLGSGALLGAAIASRLAIYVDPRTLAILFAVVLTLVALRMAWPDSRRSDVQPRPTLALAAMPMTGVAAGLLGVGGGIIQVPVMRLLLGLSMRRSVATSTVMNGWTAGVASLAYLRRSQVELEVVPWMLLGVMIGAWIAPASTRKIGGRTLELSFALLMLWTAWRMARG